MTQVQVPYPEITKNSTVSHQMLRSLEIIIKNKNENLTYGVDESYTLDIPTGSSKATLKSETVWGSIRGLETFSQLIRSRPERNNDGEIAYYEDDDERENQDGFEDLYIPNAPIKIKDSPKYSHRGIMLGRRNFF
jgi:hexosaminidase